MAVTGGSQSAELAATIELQDSKVDNAPDLEPTPETHQKAESEPPPNERKQLHDRLQIPSPADISTTRSQSGAAKPIRVLRVRRLKSLVDSYDNLGEHRMSDPFRDDESDYLMESLEQTISFSGIAQDLDRRRKKSKLLCEALVFIPFYFLFILMLSLNRDVNKSYLLENAIQSRLLHQPVTAESDGNTITFEDVTTLTYLWDWIIEGFIPIVFRDDWYNGDVLEKELWHTVGYQTRLVGGFRLQQTRGKSDTGDTCYDSPFDDLAPTCQSSHNSKSDISCGGRPNCTYVANSEAYQYRCDEWDSCGFYQEFNFFDYVSNSSLSTDLITVELAQSEAEQLRDNRWIDEQTRSVSVKANFYNNNYKMWVVVNLNFECSLSGQVLPVDSDHYALRMDIFNTQSASDVGMIVMGVFYILSVFGFGAYLVYRYYYHAKNDVEMIIDEDEEFDDQTHDSANNVVDASNYNSPQHGGSSSNLSNVSNLKNQKGTNVNENSTTETTAQQSHQMSPPQPSLPTPSVQGPQGGLQGGLQGSQTKEQFEHTHDRHHGSRLKVKRVRKISYFNKWEFMKRSTLNMALIVSHLCVLISFLVFAFDETRNNCLEWKSDSSDVDFDKYVPLNNLIRIDDTFRSFVVLTLVLLTLSSVRYFQITNSGEAVFMALVNALPIILSYLPIYLLTLFGFAIAGHWLFGMELEQFSTITYSFFSVVEMNFGLFSVEDVWDLSWVGNIYVLTVLLVFIPFLLNIFLAITINSWDDFLAFRKQLKNPLNSGISPVPVTQTILTLWYRLPLVQVREGLLRLLLEDKLDYNQVKASQLKGICHELQLGETKTNLLLKWFWKIDVSTLQGRRQIQ